MSIIKEQPLQFTHVDVYFLYMNHKPDKAIWNLTCSNLLHCLFDHLPEDSNSQSFY